MRLPFQKTFAQKHLTRENAQLGANLVIIGSALVPVGIFLFERASTLVGNATQAAGNAAARFRNRRAEEPIADVG